MHGILRRREQEVDIFGDYLSYVRESEPPIHYHRWCYLSLLGASIGRRAYFSFGHFRIFPNLYTMLIGEPAARKSTSIKMAKNLLSASGYTAFAADKTSKEKFLLDLEGVEDETHLASGRAGDKGKLDAVTAETLWGDDGREPREVFVVADEFNEFSGTGNTEFYTTLGNLWDWDNPDAPFTHRLKNSRSVKIFQPTISILSGNTPELFSRAFPPESLGTGFLSRLLLIHGERSGRRITFPPPPDALLGEKLKTFLRRLGGNEFGEIGRSRSAEVLLDDIYQNGQELPDIRFRAYSNRRFSQLLKLCLILAAAKFRVEIDEDDVIQANTILSHAELLMPKALGEFGKSRNSEVANKIMELLERATKPVTTKDIWAQVHKDLNGQRELVELLGGLVQAEKIQMISKPFPGFLPKKLVKKDPIHVDWELITDEERSMI